MQALEVVVQDLLRATSWCRFVNFDPQVKRKVLERVDNAWALFAATITSARNTNQHEQPHLGWYCRICLGLEVCVYEFWPPSKVQSTVRGG